MDAFVGEIRVFPFNFAPRGWAQCNGQLLPINQNQALFSLLGTSYGGNGQSNFGLPNLMGKVMLGTGVGNGMQLTIGNTGGTENVTLLTTNMPQHNHNVQVLNALGTANVGTGTNYLAQISLTTTTTPPTNYAGNGYNAQLAAPATLAANTIATNGGNAPHENRQPYSVLNVCICLQGYYPSRN